MAVSTVRYAGRVLLWTRYNRLAQDGLFMIPLEVDMAAIEIELVQEENYLGQLREVLAPIRASGDFDAVVLDCPPPGDVIHEQLSGCRLFVDCLAVRVFGDGRIRPDIKGSG